MSWGVGVGVAGANTCTGGRPNSLSFLSFFNPRSGSLPLQESPHDGVLDGLRELRGHEVQEILCVVRAAKLEALRDKIRFDQICSS